MNPIESLSARAGNWRGVNTLEDPNTGKPEESPSKLSVVPVLGGRFVRLDYVWSYQGKPQEGSLLVGFDPKSGEISGHWIDTWHNGRNVLACKGKATPESDPASSFGMLGSYPAPPGPDWNWRIEIDTGEGSLRIRHINIIPEGTPYPAGDYPAVEGIYEPA
ncbi:DUF1579 family protein [Aquisphaera insulae]|uniref:DUF1579 family protein n=1 Tax=Aquisphaera insulae TaxID=2712864 RepID=UPI0013EDF779|nr:DUF1579 family protein [Aquisphaera insulae]